MTKRRSLYQYDLNHILYRLLEEHIGQGKDPRDFISSLTITLINTTYLFIDEPDKYFEDLFRDVLKHDKKFIEIAAKIRKELYENRSG